MHNRIMAPNDSIHLITLLDLLPTINNSANIDNKMCLRPPVHTLTGLPGGPGSPGGPGEPNTP